MSAIPTAVPADLQPFAAVREHAADARRRGRLHPAALAEVAGYRDLRTATRLGGAAAPGCAVVATAAALARADGAAAWVLGEHWTASWIAGLLPDEVARRVLASGAVGGTLAPTGALDDRPGADPVLRGAWDAVCGAADARWQVVVAVRTSGGGEREPVAVVVEAPALRRADAPGLPGPGRDGLRGAGRARVVADGVPVPPGHVLRLVDVLLGRPGDPLHGAPLVPVAGLPVAGAMVGLGRAALDAAAARGRRAPARVAAGLDRAGALAVALGTDVDARTDRPWTRAERAAARAGLDAVVRLVQESVTELAADARVGDGRLAEVLRDVHAVDRFGDARDRTPDRYTRALCGLHL